MRFVCLWKRSHVWHNRCSSTTSIDWNGAPTSLFVVRVSGLNKLGPGVHRAPLVVVSGCQCSRPYGHAGVLHRLRQLTGVSRWSAVTKVQFKSLVFLVRLLRVQLANFTPSFEFQLEARVAIALFCSFMQVDSRTMGRSNWITPGSVAPVLMDLENRCLKDPTKLGWVACHPPQVWCTHVVHASWLTILGSREVIQYRIG